MQIDFINTPYTTRPSMSRNTGPVFNSNPNLDYIREKQKELEFFKNDLWGITDECNNHQLVRRASILCGFEPTNNIVDLALQLEEDIAIVHQGKLSAVCFCFPSGWIPREKVGLPLSKIHEAVADGDLLSKMSDRLASTMADNFLGSFRRYVWTITTSSQLSNHPAKKTNYIPNKLEDLYFRFETQTTKPLGDGLSSLFFVKVDVIPLLDVWDNYSLEILNSINSMTDNVLAYKNLHNIKSLLNKQEEGLISHK